MVRQIRDSSHGLVLISFQVRTSACIRAVLPVDVVDQDIRAAHRMVVAMEGDTVGFLETDQVDYQDLGDLHSDLQDLHSDRQDHHRHHRQDLSELDLEEEAAIHHRVVAGSLRHHGHLEGA